MKKRLAAVSYLGEEPTAWTTRTLHRMAVSGFMHVRLGIFLHNSLLGSFLSVVLFELSSCFSPLEDTSILFGIHKRWSRRRRSSGRHLLLLLLLLLLLIHDRIGGGRSTIMSQGGKGWNVCHPRSGESGCLLWRSMGRSLLWNSRRSRPWYRASVRWWWWCCCRWWWCRSRHPLNHHSHRCGSRSHKMRLLLAGVGEILELWHSCGSTQSWRWSVSVCHHGTSGTAKDCSVGVASWKPRRFERNKRK